MKRPRKMILIDGDAIWHTTPRGRRRMLQLIEACFLAATDAEVQRLLAAARPPKEVS